jgi:hypothetical protein
MIPGGYATWVAILFVAGGLITCFAGYRLFRFVLGLYGFFAGAMIGSSSVDPSSTLAVIMGFIVGGVVGAVLMVLAYFVAVGLVGAALAATLLHFGWKLIGGDPPTLLVIIVCVIGAVVALQIQRWVVIVGTAIGGAWTAMTGIGAFMGEPKTMTAATSAPNMWVVYPLDLMPPTTWLVAGWVVLALVGMVVQMKTTTKLGRRKSPN